ncbi:hypothetical protein LGK95_18085 [Clostridium algoriphilum]|uniref:hypothetical protein n=1 Tax=Clostridium algoriphilum TaxID=198347 RepID=UPI001CF26E4E|nr:hypothetical protein [Clostridium algoriphilum]MCB2295396.1 hypothetical protein [Clostridium algoriphilum]
MGDNDLNSSNEKAKNVNREDSHRRTSSNTTGTTGTTGTSNTSGTSNTTDTSNNFDVKTLAEKATDINILRFELDRLPLDFKARAYFENDIKPLIDTLYTLGLASLDFSATAASLANTNFGRSSKIKDALDLVEGVDEISGDVLKVLRCKVDKMLKFSSYDIK